MFFFKIQIAIPSFIDLLQFFFSKFCKLTFFNSMLKTCRVAQVCELGRPIALFPGSRVCFTLMQCEARREPGDEAFKILITNTLILFYIE